MKTKGVSKYDIHWQIVRSELKGSFNENLEFKTQKAFKYFNENPNKDRKERVLNWLQGLERGTKDSYRKNYLKAIIEQFSELAVEDSLEATANRLTDFNCYSQEKLLHLYYDLFKTNEKWLKNGYFHKECNEFIDTLLCSLSEVEVSNRYSKEKLIELRLKASSIPNTHKFLF